MFAIKGASVGSPVAQLRQFAACDGTAPLLARAHRRLIQSTPSVI